MKKTKQKLLIPMEDNIDMKAARLFEKQMFEALPGVDFLLVYGMRGNATWVEVDT